MQKELNYDRLRIKAVTREDRITAFWSGQSANRDPAERLSPFLKEILEFARVSKVLIEMNFTEMEFMNSSTITPIVQFLDQAKGLGLSVLVLFNKEKTWQEVCFSAMKFFESEHPPVVIREA